MIPDDELVMISALQHCLFCKRQCALIHVEGAWQENYLTATGRTLHEHVDKIGAETRRDIHGATSLRLVSNRLGVSGVADMVEFQRVAQSKDADGLSIAVQLPKLVGWWKPFPVEYKRGKPKAHRADEVQLCAQAICLEEMLGVVIREGALFYGEPRRRAIVAFDGELRALTESVAAEVHALLRSGVTPPAVITKGCNACSLKDLCLVETPSVRSWVDKKIDEVVGELECTKK